MSGEYFCHKHRRVCRPVGEADKFLRRYVRDAVQRVQEFADLRSAASRSRSSTATRGSSIRLARSTSCSRRRPTPASSTTTSSMRMPIELLGLERRDSEEIGRGVKGYCDDIAAVLARAGRALRPGARS